MTPRMGLAGVLLILTAPLGAAEVTFSRYIRPILSDACFSCHGPDAAKRKADLRLDTEEAAFAVLSSGAHAFVPGKPQNSEAYQRLLATGKQRMPPKSAPRQLTATEITTIRTWIEQGAKWQGHWAFQVPKRPPLPATPSTGHNPIDAFVLARLQAAGLVFAPPADRATLLRRATLDLTGLPPTPDEVDAFITDRRPGAYERAIDRLLASPRLGERLAIRWLDAARYADTSGYQSDGDRVMWRWRDGVIESFNHNQGFDQFTIEQLAGDLLPSPSLEQQIASGFNRNHRGNAEGGIIPEEYAAEYVADRVETTATVWLGLTMACARCHDHKYDPVSTKDFYRMYAFFNNIPERGKAIKVGNSPPVLFSPTRFQREQLDHLNNLVAQTQHQTRRLEPELLQAIAIPLAETPGSSLPLLDGVSARFALHGTLGTTKTATLKNGQPAFVSGKVGQATHFGGKCFIDAGDVGKFGYFDRLSLAAWVYPEAANGTILSRMVDAPEAEGYSVRLRAGHLQVNLVKRWLDDAIRIETDTTLPLNAWRHVLVTYDGSRVAEGVRVYLDGKLTKTRILLDDLNQSFAVKEPFRIGAGNGPEDRFTGRINDATIYNRALDNHEAAIAAVPETPQEIAALPPLKRSPPQQAKYRRHVIRNTAPSHIRDAYQSLTKRLERLRTFIDSVPTTMVMQELPQPRESRVLIRGQYDRPGDKVTPGVPSALPAWPQGQKLDRLGLARWLVAAENPLTARVAVNRFWQILFGAGLVRTTEDFGVQGEAPSHPELLDWLAVEFRDSAWDIKRLLRLIVLSQTYQQSSHVTPEQRRIDPENRLLASAPRLRLPAEMIRDQVPLAASGLLVEQLGGPSVKPYQPDGLWQDLADSEYIPDRGTSLHRRGLYTFWKRTVAPPAMVTFDAAGRETCTVRESRTNTPLQALNLLNDPTYVEAARVLASRVMNHRTSVNDRVVFAFRLVLARSPKSTELNLLTAAYCRHLDRYRQNRNLAEKLIQTVKSPPDTRHDAAELAAYTALASVIFNLDEAVTRE